MSLVKRNLVVVGASAGGIEALRALAATLPPDFPAAVLVTVHLGIGARSALPLILDRAGPLPAKSAEHGADLAPGTIYVAPPDRHLLTAGGKIVLPRGPTESGHRPAANAMFRSAALTEGPRVIGVVLSGMLDDGAAGLRAIVDRGGLAVVQDPADALFAGMPTNALAEVETEHVLPAAEIGAALDKLARTPVDPPPVAPPSDALRAEDLIAREGVDFQAVRPGESGPASGYTCPDRNGALVAVGDAPERYRCRIGHAWSAEALLGAQDEEFERALSMALRSLDEKAGLARKLERRSHDRGHGALEERYSRSAGEAADAAKTLRRFLVDSVGAETEEEVRP
ncbi:chemotaxis protein CheB [Amycolatopsis sp. NPDC051372]|uniref:chemotaxis protein CheB n=1 Tax=Amycolatopsis sp. NPDC051372 TaxID=3155669 RepID=UPI00344915E1